jgi:ribosomal protein S18 acetylase RimI-like enzyme
VSGIRKYLHDLRTLPADAALAYRHEGVRGAWKALAARSLHRLIRVGRLIVFAQTLDAERDLRLPSGVTITTAMDRDCTVLATLVGQRELSRFEALLANGRHCLIAWRGNRPVGYAWVADEIGPDVTLWPFPIEFPRSAAYLWNLYVLPSERSSGIGSALAEARLRLAREQGFHEGWRMVAPSNTASLRTVQKSARGARVVGEIRFVELLNRTYAQFRPHNPDAAEAG